MGAKKDDHASEEVALNDPAVVEELRKSRDEDAIWLAYRAEIIDEKTAVSILPDKTPSSTKLWVQAIGEAFNAMRGRSR